MKILGFDISRSKTATKEKSLVPVKGGGFFRVIREPFTGAWQRNMECKEPYMNHYAVYRCISAISQSIAAVPFELKQRQGNGIWKQAWVPNVNEILRRPNHLQNQMQFVENYLHCKLVHGNTYVLKQRDASGYVIKLFVLDPKRVEVMVTDFGDIFYKLKLDNIAGKLNIPNDELMVPSSEIVHDRMFPTHPLIGNSPLSASAMGIKNAYAIQQNTEEFFANASQPGGILTAPGNISEATALSLQEKFEGFVGDNTGGIAVVGDGLKYEQIGMSAHDSQLIEQLRFTTEQICVAFGVPTYKVTNENPPGSSVESQAIMFYNDCLAYHVESMEHCWDQMLELRQDQSSSYGIFWKQTQMMRMDTQARYTAHKEAIGAGWKSPNEVRAEEDMDPVEGGDTPYLQQQNYSLSALHKRDETNPLALPAPTSAEGEVVDMGPSKDQISSILEIVARVSSGQMPIDTASKLLSVSFPFLSAEVIKDILSPLEIALEEEPEVEPVVEEEPTQDPPVEGEGDEGEGEEDDSEEQVEQALRDLVSKFAEGLKNG